MSASDVLNKINEYGVKFVDFRFTDTKGKEQHVSIPASQLEEERPGNRDARSVYRRAHDQHHL
jgi:glutamine synthetase